MTPYQKVCEEIAIERPHVCSGCGTNLYLSHSHLIPRSYRKDLESNKLNITYHCMSRCHSAWEGMNAPLLNDFERNIEIVMQLDETYFLRKFFKLLNHWEKKLNERRLDDSPKDKDAVVAVNKLYAFAKNKMLAISTNGEIVSGKSFDLSKT